MASRSRRGEVTSNEPGLKHDNMPYTVQMPSSDGRYTYIFRLDCKGIKYPCLHLYFLTSAVDYPNNNVFVIALMECNINITATTIDCELGFVSASLAMLNQLLCTLHLIFMALAGHFCTLLVVGSSTLLFCTSLLAPILKIISWILFPIHRNYPPHQHYPINLVSCCAVKLFSSTKSS